MNENEEFTSSLLLNILKLEYESIEPDSVYSETEIITTNFFNFINKLYENSKKNLKYNIPKYIKFHFIRKTLADLKVNIIYTAIKEHSDGVELVPEAVENEKRRKNLKNSKTGLRELKVAIEVFKRTLLSE